MNPRSPLGIWLIALAFGAGAAILAAAIGILGFLVIFLVIPGVRARTWLAATAGALTGFGAVTLLLLLRPPGAGGAGDDGTLFLIAGVVPLVAGLALGGLALMAVRDGRTD